jgi:CYTH domain-containing protein
MRRDDIETERKFIVTDVTVIERSEGTELLQGYLPLQGESAASVRVRRESAIDNELWMLCIKSSRIGISRSEVECVLTNDVAHALLKICGSVISKTRYPYVFGNRVWTIDVFHGENEGLVLAEIELESSFDTVDIPDWCGAEVSDDDRYYNEYLARHPYSKWLE